jgi:predicted ester cyclase
MNIKLEELYRQWVDAWNGDLSTIDIIDDSFVFHREHGQPEVKGPKQFTELVEQSRSAFSGLTFETSIGPICDDEWVVGRNEAKGVYLGGIPGAEAPKNTKITLTGIDMLRIKNGKIVECWHNGNDLAFMLQLQAVHFNK